METVSSTTITGEVHINDGPAMSATLTITQEIITQWSALPRPDTRWTAVDSNGHFHAYDQSDDNSDRYPTLNRRVEVVSCTDEEHDIDCEGGNITHYHCRICDEELKPGILHGEHSFTIPGMKTWDVVAMDDLPSKLDRGQVSVRFVHGDARQTRELFGVGLVDVFDNRITGFGPLGRRIARTAVLPT